MANQFARIAFTETVREKQQELGSRDFYSRMDEGVATNHELTQREQEFLSRRDSFYLATVSETGWPYIQHRGGPTGFVRVLDQRTIGFSDFRGNRQFISLGNVATDDRVSLFFMDYPQRQRLKMLGRMRLADANDQTLLETLAVGDYRAKIDRAFIITVEAFDWNCPQHITPRYTMAELDRKTPE